MSDTAAIKKLYEDATTVTKLLLDNSEISLKITVEDHFRKVLILAAASYFEYHVCNSVLDFIREHSASSPLVENFVKNKAITRQYHTWFRWEDNNANHFYGLFGDEFKSMMTAKVKKSNDLRASIQAFLEISNERNRLVHQNYIAFPLEKTLDEIYELYKQSLLFIEYLPLALRGNNIDSRDDRDRPR